MDNTKNREEHLKEQDLISSANTQTSIIKHKLGDKYKKIEFWGIMTAATSIVLAVIVFGFDIYWRWKVEWPAQQAEYTAMQEDREKQAEDRETNLRTQEFEAWKLLSDIKVSTAPKKLALEFLASRHNVLNSIELSCEASGGELIKDESFKSCSLDINLSGLKLPQGRAFGNDNVYNIMGDKNSKRFDNCDFSWSRMQNAKISNWIFSQCKIQGVQFGGSQFESLVFWNSNLANSNFSMVALRHTYCRSSNMKGVALNGVDLTGSVFNDCSLNDGDYALVNLSNTKIYQSNPLDQSLIDSSWAWEDQIPILPNNEKPKIICSSELRENWIKGDLEKRSLPPAECYSIGN